jgi:hypothetical protein
MSIHSLVNIRASRQEKNHFSIFAPVTEKGLLKRKGGRRGARNNPSEKTMACPL